MTSGVCVFALVFGMDIAEHSQYKDFTWAIKLNRLGLELLGLWPKSDKISKNNFSSDLRVIIIFVIVTFVSGIPLACSLIRVWGDMILMIDNLQITLPLLVVSLKLVVLRWKQTALVSIIKMMAEDWMELKTRKERDVMMSRAQIARTIIISGYILMVLAFIVVIILPYFGLPLRHLTNLTDPDKPLPLQTYYFYDIDKSPQFELTYIIQAITIFLAAVTYTSVITEGSNFSAARLCFPLMGITILFSHAFIYCGAGEIVTMQCEEVYYALCNLEWYELEPKKARSLILLMIRASQPFRITAGKIFPLTMTTFGSLLKTSAGYISFLLANQR
ncbi:PREDICTED: uncharacterized protein LOC108755609 [Trachymyrmex septentrionalis]|uniref:uncharacterized protein LOC108755609 n=1 Tax=Trachymyrmex septentrionalis TaxID=34720 RepID=UPI00084F1FEB|nr:PREDICTED: uncharacterized protein LOC108755609 [Trachymyrmex septentrionalis]